MVQMLRCFNVLVLLISYLCVSSATALTLGDYSSSLVIESEKIERTPTFSIKQMQSNCATVIKTNEDLKKFNFPSNNQIPKICINSVSTIKLEINTALLLSSQTGHVERQSMSNEALSVTADNSNNFYVSNGAELQSALDKASAGDTILLAPGEYGELDISNLTFASSVVVKSASTIDLASFSSLNIVSSSNIVFDGIRVDFEPGEDTVHWDAAVRIYKSNDVKIINSSIEGGEAVNGVPYETEPGGLDDTGHVIGLPAALGVYVSESQDIVLENNDISEFGKGIGLNVVDGIDILGNEIHDLRSTPLRGGDVSNVLVDGNNFYNLEPWKFGPDGDHGDFVHFWTRPTTQDEPSENITITNNFFRQGEGEALLGIYLDDDGHGIGYEQVNISNNVIYNGNMQGVRIENGSDVLIQKNTLLQSSGGTEDGPTILLKDGGENIVIKDNILSHEITVDDDVVGVNTVNNLFVQNYNRNSEYYTGDLFVNSFTGDNADLFDLQALPNGVVEQLGVGAGVTIYDPNGANGSAGFIASEAGSGFQQLQLEFNLEGLSIDGSPVEFGDYKFAWNFGDGNSAIGPIQTHTYANGGEFSVSVTVEAPNGQKYEFSKTVKVETPIVLHSNFDENANDLSSVRNSVKIAEGVSFENGSSGKAVQLNGEHISYSATPDFYNNPEYTILFDFKTDDSASSGRVVTLANGFSIFINNDAVSVQLSTDQDIYWMRTDKLGISDSNWHSLALTFSGVEGFASLFVDGREVAKLSGLEDEIQSAIAGQPLYLGDPWKQGFAGSVDNFAFLNGALSADQVKSGSLDLESILGSTTSTSPSTPPDNDPSDDSETGAGDVQDTDLVDEPDPDAPVVEPEPTNIINGSSEGETIRGSEGADEIFGQGGKDRIYGGSGEDVIHMGDTSWGRADGEDGNDSLYGGTANDVLLGGIGNDYLFGGAGSDLLFGGAGDDRLEGGAGRDKLYGENGDDTLIASDAKYNLLEGGEGNDVLFGGASVDYLHGDEGDDVLFGGEGDDHLSGGSGSDKFVFGINAGQDTLADFEVSMDQMSFNGLGFESTEEILNSMFASGSNVIINLDGPGGKFSWSKSNYVKVLDVNLEDFLSVEFELSV